MVKVAGCWELGWNTPILEFDLWHFLLAEFAVDELIMTPVSGIDGQVTEFRSMQDALEANKGLVSVFCHEDGEHDLDTFYHPENAIYIFGKANYSPFNNLHKQYGGTSLKIRTNANRGTLWPHQAASIVLYDRFLKWQSQ